MSDQVSQPQTPASQVWTEESMAANNRVMVCKNLGVVNENLHLDTHFIDDLEADSLDSVELVMEVEDAYKFGPEHGRTCIPEKHVEQLFSLRRLDKYSWAKYNSGDEAAQAYIDTLLAQPT